MRRFLLLLSTLAIVTSVIGAVALRLDRNATPARAAGGATLSLGTVTFDGTHVRVPIMVSGSGFDPYSGVTAVLLWDPAVFTYSSFDTTGSIIPSPFCAAGVASSGTGPHNGVTNGENVGCTTLGSPITATGLAVTIVLTPSAGCSPLHLLTLGPPDNDPNGSVTLDSAANNQINTYGTIDVTVTASGAACSLPTSTATVTSTPTITNTPTITPTRTSTPTPTQTGTPTVTNTPPSGATFTPTPTVDANLDSDGDGYPDQLEISLGHDPYRYCVIMRADVNMDHSVQLADLIIVAGWYGKSIPPAPARYDQNADNKINLSDLIIMSGVYRQNISGCPLPTPTPTPTVTNTPTPTFTPTATPTIDPTLDSDGDGYTDLQEMAIGKDRYRYCVVMRADVNMDGKVDLSDFIIVAGVYNQAIPPAPPRYDQNVDGMIKLSDLIIMSSAYGQSVSVCP